MGSGKAPAVLCALATVVVAAALTASPGPAPSVASAGPDPASLQATLEDARRDLGVPGVSAAVVDDGALVWSGVAGERTLDGAPVTPSTRFITASAGKSVTAAMVLLLAQEGELALGDRVSEYVRGLPGARRVRLRNLLEHSSGLPDYLSNPRIWRLIESEPGREWTRSELLDAVGRLRFRPGSRVSYSNTNYIALGAVIEEVTGGSIEDAFQRLVAGPMGLADSSWLYDPSLFDDGAHPYRETRSGDLTDSWDAGFVHTDFVGEVWTDGGLATTGADLARFANALVVGDLLDPAERRALLRFRERGFGRGVFSYRQDGRRIIGHDGVYDGFTAQHWTEPRTGITVAVLANLEPRGLDPSWAIYKRLARATR